VTTTSADGANYRRSVALLVAAAVLVLVVVAIVLLFGVVRPPALPALSDAPTPAPPAAVAWSAWERDGSCVTAAWPDGRVDEELHCESDGGEVVAWTQEGIVLTTWRGAGSEEVVVDPATGEVVDWRTVEPDGDPPEPVGGPSGAVHTERRDGVLVVTDDRHRVLWEVEAADAYEVTSGARSRDGGWYAMVDSAERLLVVPADGSASPRVWAEGVPRWQRVVWQGTER